MGGKNFSRKSLRSILSRDLFYLNKSKLRCFRFMRGKSFFLRKGFYWRSIIFDRVRHDIHVGEYLSSRKPFSRLPKNKKKR